MQMSQNQRVLDFLITHGYCTQVIASNYGIRRLASRINDLKKTGVLIKSEILKDDAGVPYARYSLVNQDAEAVRRRQGFAWRSGSAPDSYKTAA